MPDIKRKSRPAAEPRGVPDTGPQFAWGQPLFGSHEPDDGDGALVAGLRLVRGPDGQLYGIAEPNPPEETQ